MSKSFKYKTSNYIFVASRLCRDPRLLLAYCLFTLLSAITQIASLALLGDFITQIISTNNSGVLGTQKLLSYLYNFLLSYISDFELSTLIGLCFIFSSILNLVFSILNVYFRNSLTASLGTQFATDYFKEFIRLDYTYAANYSVEYVINAIQVQIGSVISTINYFLQAVTSIVICSAILFSLLQSNFSITIVVSLLIFISYLVIFKLSSRIARLNSTIINDSNKRRIKLINDAILGLKELNIYNLQSSFLFSFQSFDKSIRFKESQNNNLAAMPRYFIENIGLIGIIGASLFLFSVNTTNAEVVSWLGVMALGIQKLLPLVQQLYNSLFIINSNTVMFNQFFDDLKYNRHKSLTLHTLKPDNLNIQNTHFNLDSYCVDRIELNSLSFKYDDSDYILDDVSLTLTQGKIIGIIGSSGSGKTTAIDLILGLLNPTSGQVNVFLRHNVDNTILSLNKHSNQYQSLFAFLPQVCHFTGDSIIENIALNQSLSDLDIDKYNSSLTSALLPEFTITPSTIKTSQFQKSTGFSGGQFQRLGLARAHYQGRKILVLDEPTSALDNFTQEQVLNNIKCMSYDLIIMISHRHECLDICDEVYALIDLKLVNTH